MILGALTSLASPRGRHARLSAFYFHRVVAATDPLLPGEPDAGRFDAILSWIGAQFHVLDPIEACDRLFAGELPSRAAIISFDDGYRNNLEVALPILQRHRMNAVFFVATAFLDGECMFNDRVVEAIRRCTAGAIGCDTFADEPGALPLRDDSERRAAIARILDAIKGLPPAERGERVARIEGAARTPPARCLMLDADGVATLSRSGMHIGGHTRTHPILCALDEAAAIGEIMGGLDDLQSIVGRRPSLFAYPNGRFGHDFDERHVTMVGDAGCAYAFTTHAGAATHAAHRLQLPRFTPWGRSRLRFGLLALRNLARPNRPVADQARD